MIEQPPSSLFSEKEIFVNISSRAELADWLGITDKRLRYLLFGISDSERYRSFDVPKKYGGTRKINAPIDFLAGIQRSVSNAVSLLSPPRHIAMAYQKGRGIADNARVHAGKKWVFACDISDFFPSINFGRVRGMFMSRPFKFNPEVATILAQICCHEGCLPQGAPSSPSISNAICRSLDRRLLEMAKKYRVAVTRYADDIVFSGNHAVAPSWIARADGDSWVASDELSEIFRGSGFSLNPGKTKFMPMHRRQMVTGLVVNSSPSMPREWRRRLRVVANLINKFGEDGASTICGSWASPITSKAGLYLAGATAFSSYLDSEFGTQHMTSIRRMGGDCLKYVKYFPRYGSIRILTEGKTDRILISHALDLLKKKGKYKDLDVGFPEWGEGQQGDKRLIKELDGLVAASVDKLTIGFFDADDTNHVAKYGGEGNFKLVANTSRHVYAAIIPRPNFWQSGRYCIEHYFPRDFSTREAEGGRRLFFADEFNDKNVHSSGAYVKTNSSSTLVCEEVLNSVGLSSAALTKSDFANMVVRGSQPFSDFDPEWFSPIFDRLSQFLDSRHFSRS